MDGTNIDPYLPPLPIPGLSKSLLPGPNELERIKTVSITFYGFAVKAIESHFEK